MSDVVYRPGEWQVVVEESGVAALPADASADKVVALSAMLSRGVPELTEVIDVLSGGAITGLGSFAVALIGPTGTRFAVRGAVTVTTGWDVSFSGEDITTWSERFIAEPARFELGFGASGESVAYPIRSGVVLASGVRVGEAFEEPVVEAVEEPDQAAGDVVVVPVVTDDAADADLESDDATESEAAAEEEPEPEAEPELEAEPEAEAEAEPEAEAEVEAEVEAEPAFKEPTAESSESPESAMPTDIDDVDEVPTETIAPGEVRTGTPASDEVSTDTIAPDEVARARTDEPQDPWSDPLAQPDLSATIVPPAPPSFASVVTPPAPPAPPADSGPDIGDHDGATISLAEARRLRAATSAPDAPTEVMPTLPDAASGATSARIRLSTGQVVELDRTVIIGRKPRSTRASGTTMPHLIAVDSPESDISRNHLEIRPEGDSVVVIDLHTTNGSTLLRPGADPVRLHPGEQTLVLGGDVIDLGDGVTVMIEEFG